MPLDGEWRKPSRSTGQNGCMIVRRAPDGMIEVGDDKVPGGPILRFTVAEWEAAIDGFRQGEFNL